MEKWKSILEVCKIVLTAVSAAVGALLASL